MFYYRNFIKKIIVNYIFYFIIFLIFLFLAIKLPVLPLEYRQLKNNTKAITQEVTIPSLIDETIERGIVKAHMQSSEKLSSIPESFGAGACILDYNNDGWMDIFLINGSGQRRHFGEKEWWQSRAQYTLYKNTGMNTFEDVTDFALGKKIRGWGMGCSAADLDNDGDEDLIISNYGDNILLENNADGTFKDSTIHSKIKGESWSTSILTADFNNDGLLDIYILNFIDYKQEHKTYEASSGYNAGESIQFTDSLYDSTPNQLYINKGNLTFEDKTETSGLADVSGRGISTEALDINNDGLLDIFISNGQGSPNKLYINNNNFKFTEASELYKISTIKRSTGIDYSDIDNDGSFDLLVGSDNKNPKLLYRKNKNGPLVDIAKTLGVDKAETSSAMTWGVTLSDLNNDGNTDIFLANGFLTPDSLSPRKPQGQPNSLLINTLDDFKPCDSNCYLENSDDIGSSRSVIPVDIDNDGDTDLYISQNNELGKLLINHTENKKWLGIRLIGKTSNRDALGSMVTLTSNSNRKYIRKISNTSYLSSKDKRIVFNLNNEETKELSIKWSSGNETKIYNLPNNRYITIIESEDKFSQESHITPIPDKSKIIFSKLQHKIQAIEWLVNSNFKREANFETNVILSNKVKPQDLSNLLNFSNLLTPQISLKIYLIGIKNNNTEIRLKALEKLKYAEQEISSRFLLNLFSDPSPLVRCEIARVYLHFFKEEEAMIHSKYQAIPKLINALSDNSNKVQTCAIDALGESESYRAVQPLMRIISLTDAKNNVKKRAIIALGRLREKKSEKLLVNILHNSKEAISNRYAALGALKRLNVIDENFFLIENLEFYYDNGRITEFLEILLNLSKDSEHNIIINPISVRKALNIFILNNGRTLSEKESNLVKKIISMSQTGTSKKLVTNTPSKSSIRLRLSSQEIKKIQHELSSPSVNLKRRIEILNNNRITHLNSTRNIIKTISNNTKDPFNKYAIVFLVENSVKEKDILMYKKIFLDKNHHDDVRFNIAKGLLKNHSQFVLKNLLTK